MSADAAQRALEAADAIYRAESRRVFATLVRLLGDFDLAEEALHDAFRAALEQWPRDGVPANPRAWLVSAGRFTALGRVERLSLPGAVIGSDRDIVGSLAGQARTGPKRRSESLSCPHSQNALDKDVLD